MNRTKITLENLSLIIDNDEMVFDCEDIQDLLNINLKMSVYHKGSRADNELNLPELISEIKISNEALLKYKDFWKQEYEFSMYTYKRGESFSYFKGSFPLYKRLLKNKKLDTEFLIDNLIPKKVNFKMLNSSDNNKDYLVEY